MDLKDSAIDSAALGYARGLLRQRQHKVRQWPAVAAAAFLAVSAIGFSVSILIAPPGAGELFAPKGQMPARTPANTG
jgi:hypothetical protein